MHSRRLACFLIGLWLGGSLLLQWVAVENLRSVDRTLSQPSPEAALRLKLWGRDQGRLMFRYAASEQNRYYFEYWEWLQIALASALFFFLLFATGEGKIPLGLALLSLALVLTQRLFLTPELNAVGRVLDFASPSVTAGEHPRFLLLHYAYLGLEAAKWTLLLVLAGFLVMAGNKHPRGNRRVEVMPRARFAG